MSKANLVIISLLVVLIVIALFTLFYFFSSTAKEKINETEETKELGELFSYSNDQWKFEIKYPHDWEPLLIDENEESFSVGFQKVSESSGNNFISGILVSAFFSEEDFETVMEEGADLIVAGARIISSEKIEISQSPAYVFEYIVTDYISSIKYLHYFIEGNDYWYQILYFAESSDYDKNIELIKRSIKSFKILII